MNRVHTKKRNRLRVDKMNDSVYIMYNNKLKEKFLKKKALKEEDDPLVVENVCSDDEWIVDPNGVMGTLEDEGEDDVDCEDDV